MIKDIREINFPEYATLSQATVMLNDMGDKAISAQVKIDGAITPDFSYDWEVQFKGERYIQPLRQPQASKGNDSKSSVIDLTFYHWAIWELKRYYFVEMSSTESGTAIADKYISSLTLNLGNFCDAFNNVLDYYFNGDIVVNLNPDWVYDIEPSLVSISYSYIWDVLQQVYEIYGVRWDISTNNGVCYINIGYIPNEVSHIFQYGYEGGLLKIERQVQDANIRNSLLGRGGEQNLPAYYFKEAPEGSLFASDPDAIPELANIYFSNLRGKTFRDYVKGWKAKHYGGEPMTNPTEEYTKGYTDEKFDPIEYVKDDESIAKYGLLQGALDNYEEAHPSIQKIEVPTLGRIDQVVDVQRVTSDDYEGAIGQIDTISAGSIAQDRTITRDLNGGAVQVNLQSNVFEVPEDVYSLVTSHSVSYDVYKGFSFEPVWSGNTSTEIIEEVIDVETNQVVDRDNLSNGKYQLRSKFIITLPIYEEWPGIGSVHNLGFLAMLRVETSLELLKVQTAPTEEWLPTFDIWVKNIWGSTRNEGENDLEYAERVWRPILGDRQGDEAKVCFSTGWLSGHNDYEFAVVGFAYDDSKTYNDVQSHWRLTLSKSDAELDAMGVYIPSTTIQANAGDYFFFIGIDMPHNYVVWAEERLDNYKRDSLRDTADIKPTWLLSLDKIRINENRGEALSLLDEMNIGSLLRASHTPFIEEEYMELYIQSMTYTFGETLLPNVEVVLSDKVMSVKNPVAQLQGEVDALAKQVGSISNIEQVVLSVGDKNYIRKNRPDTARGKISFQDGADFYNYEEGIEEGRGASIHQGSNGKSTLEIDNIIARLNSIFGGSLESPDFLSGLNVGKGWSLQNKEVTNAAGAVEKRSTLEIDDVVVRGVLRVFEFVVSQMMGENDNRTFTGMMEIDHYDSSDGKIYLNTRNGKIYNPFRVDDILVVQQFIPVNADGYITKQYELVITEVGMGDMADGEDRLDWVKFKNFTTTMEGDASTLIIEGDTLVRLDNLTDDQRKGIIQIMSVGESTPYMDVLYGAKTDPDNALKVRIGNLAGIYNALFGNLTGFGAFLSNLYGVGEFRIQHTGEDVASKLEMTRNGFSTNFRKVTYNLPESDNYLDNPSFLDNMANWVAGESGVNFFVTAQNEPIYMNRNLYAESSQFVGLDEYNGRELMRITNSQLQQLNANIKAPTFHKEYNTGDAEAEGYTEVADTMYLTIKFYCTKGGSLDVGFVDDAGEPISVTVENAISYYTTEVTASIDEQAYEAIGIWEGKGNFIIKTDGEVFIESVALSTRPLDNYKTETSTSIEQTADSIALVGQKVDAVSGQYTDLAVRVNAAEEEIEVVASRFNSDGTLKNKSGLVTKSEFSTLFAKAFEGEDVVTSAELSVYVTDDELGNAISGITITADQVDINNGVMIITSTTANIGGFQVTAKSLTNSDFTSYIRISGGSGLINHWVGINDPDGKGVVDIYTDLSKPGIYVVSEKSGTNQIAIQSIGNCNLMARYTNTDVQELIKIKGLALGYEIGTTSFIGDDDYWVDFIEATSGQTVTLPNANFCAGKILFVKGKGSNKYKTTGGNTIVMSNSQSLVSEMTPSDNSSMFFIASYSHWYAFNCT